MNGVPFALLRHASTLWNEAGRLQGAADIHLSRKGRTMAARWRLPAPYDSWPRLASPLTRARQTAQLLKPVAAFAVERRLHEVRFGLWEGRVIADIEAKRRRRSFAPGGESPPQLKRRLRDWAAGLSEPTVAVTHKGVIRAVRRLARLRGEWKDDCLQVFIAYDDGTIALKEADVTLVIER